MPLIPVLSKMERAGIEIDTEFLEGLSEELAAELAELEKEIHGFAGREFNINSQSYKIRIYRLIGNSPASCYKGLSMLI